jgi:uncharacterized surface protein with fasciclin (FAS1) repeats
VARALHHYQQRALTPRRPTDRSGPTLWVHRGVVPSEVFLRQGKVPCRTGEGLNMVRSKRNAILGVMVAGLLLVGVSCSSDDDGAADDATATTVDESTPTTKSPDQYNLVEVAVSAGSYTVLAELLQSANLVGELVGEGPFTVFAPTDEAFSALADELGLSLDELKATLMAEENADLLRSVLQYHVVAGNIPASEVVGLGGSNVTTLSGESFAVAVDGETVTITDGAGRTVEVVDVDVPAANGVIHVLGSVLLPRPLAL